MLNFYLWSDYIIRKGFFLSALLLVSSLILLVWADARPVSGLILRHYIHASTTSSLVVLAASLFGGLFLEDVLRKRL